MNKTRSEKKPPIPYKRKIKYFFYSLLSTNTKYKTLRKYKILTYFLWSIAIIFTIISAIFFILSFDNVNSALFYKLGIIFFILSIASEIFNVLSFIFLAKKQFEMHVSKSDERNKLTRFQLFLLIYLVISIISFLVAATVIDILHNKNYTQNYNFWMIIFFLFSAVYLIALISVLQNKNKFSIRT